MTARNSNSLQNFFTKEKNWKKKSYQFLIPIWSHFFFDKKEGKEGKAKWYQIISITLVLKYALNFSNSARGQCQIINMGLKITGRSKILNIGLYQGCEHGS